MMSACGSNRLTIFSSAGTTSPRSTRRSVWVDDPLDQGAVVADLAAATAATAIGSGAAVQARALDRRRRGSHAGELDQLAIMLDPLWLARGLNWIACARFLAARR